MEQPQEESRIPAHQRIIPTEAPAESKVPARGFRWLITGGCGFIGVNLIRRLLEEDGHLIRVVDDLSSGSRESLASVCRFTEFERPAQRFKGSQSSIVPAMEDSRVELMVADILDSEAALRLTEGVDVVVHLAANTGVLPSIEDPRRDCLINVMGRLNYLEAARLNNVQRFIFASSGAPIGDCTPPIHEELAPHPASPYGASKLTGEAYCSAYFHSFGLATVALRFGNVYGVRSSHKNSVVAKFIRQALMGETLTVYGDGRQTRDFIYVDDLVDAIRRAAFVQGIGGEVFQIATSKETTIAEMLQMLLDILGENGNVNIQTAYTDAQKGEIRRNFSNTSKAERLLRWKASVDLSEGLRRTVRWFIQESSQS